VGVKADLGLFARTKTQRKGMGGRTQNGKEKNNHWERGVTKHVKITANAGKAGPQGRREKKTPGRMKM